MMSMMRVVAVAHTVRLAARTAAIALLLGAVAVMSFAAHYGSVGVRSLEPASSDPLLTAAVAEQESAGLVCSARPGVTDVVLFQAAGSSSVTVLRFDSAVKAVSAREGAIRRYCG